MLPTAHRKTEKKVGRPPNTKSSKAPKKVQTYRTFLYRVLKQIHPDKGITGSAMDIVNSFMNDMFERIVTEATKLVKLNGSRTLSSRDIQSAVRLLIPGELANHAMNEGTKAVSLCVMKTTK